MPLCALCTKLDLPRVFQDREPSNHVPIHGLALSSLRDSATSCDLCQLFLSLVDFQSSHFQGFDPSGLICRIYLMDYGSIHSHKDGRTVDPVKGVFWADRHEEPVPRLIIDIDTPDQRIYGNLPCGLQQKVRDGAMGRDAVLRGRVVQPELDVELLKRWIGLCHDHDDICKPGRMMDEATGLVIRVIDVGDMCIVDLPRDAEYVVLSYVWGTTSQLRLLQENVAEFTTPQGLEKYVGDIPKTISYAIDLTRQLGNRYLWVDALCIIQDDPADLAVQIQHMNDVYGRASLTIIAAFGSDSNAGLPGLKSGSRKSLVIDEEIEGVQLVTGLPIFASAVNASIWESRGWTMQEKVLSKRLIIFTEYQVFYHCNSATWCEDSVWEPVNPRFILQPGTDTMSPQFTRTSLPSRNFTGLGKYAHLVSGYHGRKLTHQTDALNAFTGALTALSKELNTPFLWGIPESSFDSCIIWRTPFHNPGLRREQFPSWSWLGWKAGPLPGDLDFPVVLGGHIETIPVVQWHQVTETGEQKLVGKATTPYHEIPKFQPPLPCPGIPSTHFLRFRAQSVFLPVSREPAEGETSFKRYGCEYYTVGVKQHDGEVQKLATVSLNTTWREGQPDHLEFIMICWRKLKHIWNSEEIKGGGDLMLIQTTGDVSFRVQMTKDIVNRDPWMSAKPVWRVVTLG
ncbi:HET-domain-containing protein [Cadophora sp. DSE1049]|nr:HET-domain-containing protein [Cadophora sp. DSE1049]